MLREYILTETIFFTKKKVKELVKIYKNDNPVPVKEPGKRYRAIEHMVLTNSRFNYEYIETIILKDGGAALLLYKDPEIGKQNEKNSDTQGYRPLFSRLGSPDI